MNDSPRPCDSGPLDDLACQAKGVAAQAAYNADQEAELKQARAEFAAARSAYYAVRHEAEKAVKAGHDQLNRIFGNRCQIDKADAQRIDRAWQRVKVRLEQCCSAPCCDDCDCDWDDEIRDCDVPAEIAAKIAEIGWHITEAKECFDTLIDETTPLPPAPGDPAPSAPATSTKAGPAAAANAGTTPTDPPPSAPTGLAARVARVLAEIAEIEEHAEKGTWPASRVYAAALVARWHLNTVWNGFDDVNEYVDCLCRTLTCLIKGHAAVAKLKRKQAVYECFRDTWDKDCATLDEQAVDEVLAEYLRICAAGHDADSDSDSDNGCDDGGGDGDDDGGRDGDVDRDGGHGGGHGPSGGHVDKGKALDDDPPTPPEEDERPPHRPAEPARGDDRPGRGPSDRRSFRDARGRYRRP
jgi:hypothetical protein